MIIFFMTRKNVVLPSLLSIQSLKTRIWHQMRKSLADKLFTFVVEYPRRSLCRSGWHLPKSACFCCEANGCPYGLYIYIAVDLGDLWYYLYSLKWWGIMETPHGGFQAHVHVANGASAWVNLAQATKHGPVTFMTFVFFFIKKKGIILQLWVTGVQLLFLSFDPESAESGPDVAGLWKVSGSCPCLSSCACPLSRARASCACPLSCQALKKHSHYCPLWANQKLKRGEYNLFWNKGEKGKMCQHPI